MRKLFYLLLALICTLGLLAGCQNTNKTLSLSPETETEIIHAYWEKYCKIKSIREDCLAIRVRGIFEDTYVFFVDGGEKRSWKYVEETVQVAGIDFCYPSTQRLVVYHDGSFYDLQSAYDSGLLTQKDLEALPREYPENAFLTLSDQKKEAIAQAFRAAGLLPISEIIWYTAEDIEKGDTGKLQYLGTYNGYDVLYQSGQLGIVSNLTLAGYTFSSSTASSLTAYRDGKLSSVQSLYDSGSLTKQDIAAIHRMFRQYN